MWPENGCILPLCQDSINSKKKVPFSTIRLHLGRKIPFIVNFINFFCSVTTYECISLIDIYFVNVKRSFDKSGNIEKFPN